MKRRVRSIVFLVLLGSVFWLCVACPKDPEVENPETTQTGEDAKTTLRRNTLESDPGIVELLGEGLSVGNPVIGRELFKYKCDGCHESTDALGGTAWSRPEIVTQVGVIRDGRAGMPGYGSRLTGQQILDVVVALIATP